MADTPAVDEALPAVRELLRAAAVPFRIVGGIAVHHHGWKRFTEDVDVVVDADAVDRLEAHLAAHGFVRERADRIRHTASGVRIDLLVSGTPLARRPDLCFPRPHDIEPSARDPEVAALAPLIWLKLHAARRRDETDVVELLKRVDDSAYVRLEAEVSAEIRPLLAQLRDEALDELACEQG